MVPDSQLLPWLSLCLVGAAWCWTLCFCFPLPFFQHSYSGHWAEDGNKWVHWSPPHGGPSTCPPSLTSAWDFWDCFLTWPGVQWELLYLNAKVQMQKHLEARRKGICLQEQDVIPGGLHLGFIRGQVCPVWPPRSWPVWHDLKAEAKCTSPLDHHQHWALLPVVGRAAGGKQCTRFQEEQKGRDGEVACSALWKGTSFSIIHVCSVQSIRSPSAHSPISHLCQHGSA